MTDLENGMVMGAFPYDYELPGYELPEDKEPPAGERDGLETLACDECGAPIPEGEPYYALPGGDVYCEGCIEARRYYAERKGA